MSGPLVLALGETVPVIADDVYLAPNCVVVGEVEIGPGSSVWFNATLRGDVAPIRIGERSNVQDGAVLHVDAGTPCIVGNDVTIGHGAIVHGTTIGDGVTIGMGAIVLSRSQIGAARSLPLAPSCSRTRTYRLGRWWRGFRRVKSDASTQRNRLARSRTPPATSATRAATKQRAG